MPAFPGLTNSRVICNTFGTDAFPAEFSCAAVTQAQVTASDNPNRKLLTFFMLVSLLFLRTGLAKEGPRYLEGRLQFSAARAYRRAGVRSSVQCPRWLLVRGRVLKLGLFVRGDGSEKGTR